MEKVKEQLVSLDANCLTYWIEAHGINPIEPVDALADQRVALLRSYIYAPEMLCFSMSPTAWRQCLDIPDESKRANHESWDVLIDTFQVVDTKAVDLRTQELLHTASSGGNTPGIIDRNLHDYRILAECEQFGVDVLLTFDIRFNRVLGPLARGTRILRPSEFWTTLDLPRGAPEKRSPAGSNPLAMQNWWRW